MHKNQRIDGDLVCKWILLLKGSCQAYFCDSVIWFSYVHQEQMSNAHVY